MLDWINQLFHKPRRRAHSRGGASHLASAFIGESLERRELLAAAGVETTVDSLFVRESMPAEFTTTAVRSILFQSVTSISRG